MEEDPPADHQLGREVGERIGINDHQLIWLTMKQLKFLLSG